MLLHQQRIMLVHKPISIQFRLTSEWLEWVIGVGLFTYGAMLGGHFASVRDMLTHLTHGEMLASGFSLTWAGCILLAVSMSIALLTSYSAILFFLLLLFNGYICRRWARAQDDGQSSDKCWCGQKRCCARLYETCGGNQNYVGNPWIAITRAITILVDPVLGAVCGSALAHDRWAQVYISVLVFFLAQVLVMLLRTDEARRLLKSSQSLS